jgi:hypothetical protein
LWWSFNPEDTLNIYSLLFQAAWAANLAIFITQQVMGHANGRAEKASPSQHKPLKRILTRMQKWQVPKSDGNQHHST